jgi:NADP-dependent 3-hydroxy acid dehydrogenase YdfG
MADVRRQFETNVFGLVRLTQLVLPGMRKQGWGKVVNMSSMGANFVFPGGGFYHATKYAVDCDQRRACGSRSRASGST